MGACSVRTQPAARTLMSSPNIECNALMKGHPHAVRISAIPKEVLGSEATEYSLFCGLQYYSILGKT